MYGGNLAEGQAVLKSIRHVARKLPRALTALVASTSMHAGPQRTNYNVIKHIEKHNELNLRPKGFRLETTKNK